MQQGSDLNPKVNTTESGEVKLKIYVLKHLGDEHTNCGRHLVVLHSDYHLQLHGQPSSLFDGRTDDYAY